MQSVRHMLSKGDVVLIGIFLILFILSFFLLRYFPQTGSLVTISVNNKPLYSFSISEDRDITISGPIGDTNLRISENRVWITEAPCPHKICKKMGKIGRAGEIIVCIPNKIFIEVEGTQDSPVDGITM